MLSTNDRPTLVVDRPSAPQRAVLDEPGLAPPTALPDLPPPAPAADADGVVTDLQADGAPAGTPLPPGWGSREERRLALRGVAGFFLLGLYAALFVLVGAVVWS